MEVMLRALIVEERTRNGDILPSDLLCEIGASGRLEGKPCYLGHEIPKTGGQGRTLLGHWHGTRFDETVFGITGWLHSKCWAEWYHKADHGFSIHAFVEAPSLHGNIYWRNVLHVYSVDLVRDPAASRCRILDLHIISN